MKTEVRCAKCGGPCTLPWEHGVCDKCVGRSTPPTVEDIRLPSGETVGGCIVRKLQEHLGGDINGVLFPSVDRTAFEGRLETMLRGRVPDRSSEVKIEGKVDGDVVRIFPGNLFTFLLMVGETLPPAADLEGKAEWTTERGTYRIGDGGEALFMPTHPVESIVVDFLIDEEDRP